MPIYGFGPFDPASIRYNNPGAMYPGPSATAFGSTGFGTIGGGHQIARFNDPESGAAAQFNLLRRNYSGLPLDQAIAKWSGGNSSPSYIRSVSDSLGVAPNTRVSDILGDPTSAVNLAKSMARFEAGRDFPLSDEQWMNAYRRGSEGGDEGATAGGGGGKSMPTSLMDMFNPQAYQATDALGQPAGFGNAMSSRSNSLIGMGLGLMQPRYPWESGMAAALRGFQAGAQADEASAQNAWKRSLAEREFARAGETDFTRMQRDIARYRGTPQEDEVKRFYAAKMGEAPQLVTVEDPQNPGEKLSALFNSRAPQGQQFTDLMGRPLNIGGGTAAAPSSAFDQPGAGRVGYGRAGIGDQGFGTGAFGTQPSAPAQAQQQAQYRVGPKATEAETGLRKEIDQLPEVKRYVQAVPSLQSMVESSKKGSRAADLDFVYGIAQIFDPNSVVREGEMKLATGTQSLPDDVQGIIRQVALGNSRLSEQARNRLLEVAHTRVSQYRAAYDTRIGNYAGIVQRQRLNPANVLPSLPDMPQFSFSETQQQQQAPATSKAPVQRWGQDAAGNPIPIPSP